MATYQNPLEAKTALTSAFAPTTEAQRQAIERASALVPTISASSLAPATPFAIPQPKPDKTNYNQLVAGGNAFIKGSQLPTETQSQQTDLTKQLNDLISGQPSTTDLYNTAYNASGIDFAQQEALAKKRAVRAAQAELGGIQAQLQAVADSAKQQNLQLEQSINQGTTGAGGAGALASGSFLNVRQQEINRQAAIASLPLQAQALAAQAKVASLQGDAEYAQSTLGIAQEKLNTTFKLMSEDSSRKQNLQMKMFDLIYNDADKREQRQIDALKQQSTTNQSNLSDARNFAQTLSTSALSNGQADIAAQITQVPQPDITSKTFAQDLEEYNKRVAELQGQIVDPNATLDTQLKQLQIQKAQRDLAGGGVDAPTVKTINGVDMQWNPSTAKWETIGGDGVASEVSPYQQERAFRTTQSVNELRRTAVANPGIFGRTAALPIPNFMRSDAFRNFSSELNTLKSSIAFGELTAMREASKTGGALGQVSDREGKLLESALGALEMNQTPENFVKQLDKINASITRWQNAMASAQTSGTLITAPNGDIVEITD